MVLVLPTLAYRETLNNLLATPGANMGTSVTAHASIHTKGSWTQLIASTTYDAEWICVAFGPTNVAATQTDSLVDIGIGGSGAETVLIPNLLAGYVGQAVSALGRHILLPIKIPKGSRISARAQSITTAKVVPVAVWVIGGARHPQFDPTSRCDAIGVTSSGNSRGTSVTAGNTGTEGSWTSINSPTARSYSALGFLAQGTLTTHTNLYFHFEVGFNSTAIAEYFVMANTNEQIGGPVPVFPIFHFIPSGTQLQIRGECSGTAEAMSCALYGMY